MASPTGLKRGVDLLLEAGSNVYHHVYVVYMCSHDACAELHTCMYGSCALRKVSSHTHSLSLALSLSLSLCLSLSLSLSLHIQAPMFPFKTALTGLYTEGCLPKLCQSLAYLVFSEPRGSPAKGSGKETTLRSGAKKQPKPEPLQPALTLQSIYK